MPDELVQIEGAVEAGRIREQPNFRVTESISLGAPFDLSSAGHRRISLVDSAREDWSFGNGEMQYAPK